MGCDIHIQLEKFWNNNWIGILMEKVPDERNYKRFSMLADVRSLAEYEGPEPLGIPDDASQLSLMRSEEWGGDAHSHSWAKLQEFVKICLETERDPEKMLLADEARVIDPYNFYFGIYSDDPDFDLEKYRVVFWFDN